MKNLHTQLSNVADLYKTTLRSMLLHNNAYITVEDNPKAWTDGFMMDLGGANKVEAEAEATLLNFKKKLARFVPDTTELSKPKSGQIIPNEEGEELLDISSDFNLKDFMKLYSKTLVVGVNPKYISYFVNSYQGCKFFLLGETKPITIFQGENLVGILMPIRIRE